ncbi:MAG: DUF1343 domain-containing protein [Bacteroidota bacterium]
MRLILLVTLVFLLTGSNIAQTLKPILAGAERMSVYLPLLKNKKVAVFANQTSMVGNTHLVDTLVNSGIKIVTIFAPEHGFRGTADAGEHVSNTVDSATGIPIISLYGTHRKPTAADLANIDVVVFDIQDVGVRFYTYISSLQELMEATLENDKPLLVLDRPNPNGFYIDGPVLESGYQSFVGMQKVPIVYGMTIGEYARMISGEQWLTDAANNKMAYNVKHIPNADTPFHLLVIKCGNYTHDRYYELPVKPSPNLPDMQSILLYPSLCFFEGTEVSLGRGTDKPFKVYGHPFFPNNLFSFTPVSTAGAKNPPLKDKKCYGYDLAEPAVDIKKAENQQINLSYLVNAYKLFPNKDSFFIRPKKSNPKGSDYFFNKLSGNENLMLQIINGKTASEIRKSWAPGIAAFKKIRAKYLMYD